MGKPTKSARDQIIIAPTVCVYIYIFKKYSQAHVAMSITVAWRFLKQNLAGRVYSAVVSELDQDFPWLPESFHNIMNCV